MMIQRKSTAAGSAHWNREPFQTFERTIWVTLGNDHSNVWFATMLPNLPPICSNTRLFIQMKSRVFAGIVELNGEIKQRHLSISVQTSMGIRKQLMLEYWMVRRAGRGRGRQRKSSFLAGNKTIWSIFFINDKDVNMKV